MHFQAIVAHGNIIMSVADIASIRWIAKDFDNKNFRWVVNYGGFAFHYILGKNDEGRRD